MQSARRSHRMHETMCHQRQAKPKTWHEFWSKTDTWIPAHTFFHLYHYPLKSPSNAEDNRGRMITLQYANSNTQRLQKQNTNDLCDIQSRETNWLSNTLGRPSDTYFTCQRIDKATTWFSRVDNIWQKVQCYHILSDCHHTPDVHSFNCLFPFIDYI